MTPWTAERVALLRALWAEGLGCVLIARRLRCTKDSVIGKAHRLGLPAHVRQPLGGRPAAAVVRLEPLPLEPRTCCWLLTEDRPWVFCSAPVAVPGGVWCRQHMAVCYPRRAA